MVLLSCCREKIISSQLNKSSITTASKSPLEFRKNSRPPRRQQRGTMLRVRKIDDVHTSCPEYLVNQACASSREEGEALLRKRLHAYGSECFDSCSLLCGYALLLEYVLLVRVNFNSPTRTDADTIARVSQNCFLCMRQHRKNTSKTKKLCKE